MGMMAEFKDFAMKGNVVDLAVGVIIGGAFGKIVDSLVQDIVMPLLGKAIGGLDFTNMYIPLAGQAANLSLVEAKKIGAVLAYGNFLTITLNFLILAFVIFQMVHFMNRLRKDTTPVAPPAAPALPSEEVLLLQEIRDALKASR